MRTKSEHSGFFEQSSDKLNPIGVAALALGAGVAVAPRQEVYHPEGAPSLEAFVLEAFVLEVVCNLGVCYVDSQVCDRHKQSCVPNPGKDHSSHDKRS